MGGLWGIHIMPFASYVNKNTGKTYYAFEGEEYRLPGVVPGSRGKELVHFSEKWPDLYIKLPPNPKVVLSTFVYMTEDPQLDSMQGIYELDRMLNIEASEEKEAAAVQTARKEF